MTFANPRFVLLNLSYISLCDAFEPISAGLFCEDALGNRAATQTRTITVQALCPAPSFLCSDDSCADGSVSPAICGVGIEEELVGALATEVFPSEDVNTNPPTITLLPAQDVCAADPNCGMAVLEDPDDATKLTFIWVQSVMQGETYVVGWCKLQA